MPDKIIAAADAAGDFVTGDDGFVVLWPKANRGGLNSSVLRILADEVDKRNGVWAKQIEEDMETYKDPCPDCGTQLKPASGGGVKCPKCPYWFCF